MKRIVPITACAFVWSCSDSVDVPSAHYGVKTYMGEVRQVIAGPGTTSRKLFLEHVAIFPRKTEFAVTASDGEPIRLALEVIDARNFYKLCMGRAEILVNYWEPRIEQLSRKEATALLLKRLNEPGTGIVVKVR